MVILYAVPKKIALQLSDCQWFKIMQCRVIESIASNNKIIHNYVLFENENKKS